MFLLYKRILPDITVIVNCIIYSNRKKQLSTHYSRRYIHRFLKKILSGKMKSDIGNNIGSKFIAKKK